MRQFETRNISIELIANALRPYHRHGDEPTAYDALCVEFADLSTNTLSALRDALLDLEASTSSRHKAGSLTGKE
jgi:hypothetical protein